MILWKNIKILKKMILQKKSFFLEIKKENCQKEF